MSNHAHDPHPSKAAIKGHPIHPMLIPFPIAFFTLVVVTDVLYAIGEGPFWALASYYALWAGVATGVVASLAGLVDFVAIKPARAHRQGWLHAGANLSVIALAVVNGLLRVGDPTGAILPSGMILSVVGALLLMVGGWYGGELAYRHKIGVVGHEREEPAGTTTPAAHSARPTAGR